MYFLLKMGIFQPAMLVYICQLSSHDLLQTSLFARFGGLHHSYLGVSKKRQLKVSNVFFPLVFGTAVAVVDEGRRLESFQKTGRNEWDYDKDLHHFCRKTYIPTS